MQDIKVLYGHELADLTQEELLFEAADINGIGITDALTPGVVISVPDPIVSKSKSKIESTVVKSNSVKAIAGQVWVDLVLQQLGDEERIFELCDLNDAGITDDIIAGTVVEAPVEEAERRRLVNVMKRIKPASLYYGVGDPEPEGIEYWAIEIDFMVS